MNAADIRVTAWEGAPSGHWRTLWRIPRIDVYAVTGSTNDAARALAENGAAAGSTVIADLQTAGRGRMGRSWQAPPERALLLSLVLRPGARDGPRHPGTASIRVALAVARALDRTAGFAAAVKWPNDIVVPGSGKLAGILCEASLLNGNADYVVAGIGINTGQTADDFPPEIAALATSVRLVTGRAPDRAALAGEIIDALRPFDLRGLDALDPEELADMAARDVLRGAQVQVDGTAAGTAQGIAPDGALLLSTAAGTIPVHFGTVRVRETGRTPAWKPPGVGTAPRDASRERNP